MSLDDGQKIVTNELALVGRTNTINTQAIVVDERDGAGNVRRCHGTVTVLDGGAGFAKGCLYIDTDVADGLQGVYVNIGTTTACNFDVIAGGSAGATAFTGLSDVPANYTADGNKLVKVNTDETALEFVTPSGDATMDAAGAFSVVDLTISNQVAGDILRFNGTNWVRIAAGNDGDVLRYNAAASSPLYVDPATLPGGTASGLAQTTVIESGVNDTTISTTSQTVGNVTLTIPDFVNVDDTFAFLTLQQSLANKILKDDSVYFADTADTTKKLEFELVGATTGMAMTIASSHTNNVTLTLPDATDTLVGRATADTLTNKTLSDSTTLFGAVGALTKVLGYDLSGATAGMKMTIASAHTGAVTLTLPNATDTLVGKATTDTFTNKTFDALGSGNVLSNVNGTNLDPIAATTGTYAVPFVVVVSNAGSADINVFSGNAPFKLRVIDAWAVNTKGANNGSWKLQDGAAVDLSTAISYSGTDNAISRLTQLVDAAHDITSIEALHLINSDASDTSIVYISCIRVN